MRSVGRYPHSQHLLALSAYHLKSDNFECARPMSMRNPVVDVMGQQMFVEVGQGGPNLRASDRYRRPVEFEQLGNVVSRTYAHPMRIVFSRLQYLIVIDH